MGKRVSFFFEYKFPILQQELVGRICCSEKLNRDVEQSMRSRFTHTRIHQIMKKANPEVDVKEVCRKYGISRNTFYNRKNKYGGMTPR